LLIQIWVLVVKADIYHLKTNVLIILKNVHALLQSKKWIIIYFWKKIYLKDAAILPPSTVRTAPVVFFEVAKWKNALATSSALTSFNNKFPFI